MDLAQAKRIVETHLERMDEAFQEGLFDEWALVAVFDRKGLILHYSGPRKESFKDDFLRDLHSFRDALVTSEHPPGYFEFSREATGTLFDAFVVLGEGLFLICNNTKLSMNRITQNPRWLKAQGSFVEMSEQFGLEPLLYPM